MFKQAEIDFDSPLLHRQFSGSDYIPKEDQKRLTKQIGEIYNLMKDGKWRTLKEISEETGHGEASCSAQLRNLRKANFGSHTIEKRARGERKNGLWEYKIAI